MAPDLGLVDLPITYMYVENSNEPLGAMLIATHSRAFIYGAGLFLTATTTVAQGNPFVLNPSSPFSVTAEPSTAALWGDYDGDGDHDLFVGGGSGGSAIYKNEGDGEFSRIPFVLAPFSTTGGAWADFDNDGDLDLVLCAINEGTRILINNGSGAFTHTQTLESNVRGCAVADYDSDGALDLVLARRFGFSDRLYRNNGSGSFAFMHSAISSTSGDAVSVSWSDYDADGDPDLYITNITDQQNFFFENIHGLFAFATHGPHVEDATSTIGASWGDYDGDLDFDLFVANHDGYPNALYRNDGDSFVADTQRVIIDNIGESYGSAWGDVDNDGDLDLIVMNRLGLATLYVNDGTGVFVDFSFGNANHGLAVATVLADVDEDGDLDMLTTYGGHDANQVNRYYENTLDSSNNWLKVRLRGLLGLSNSTGIGARVYLKATIDGLGVWQVREMTSQSGHRAQSGQRLHFGVGDATDVDSLVIDWPSGTQQILTNVAVNQLVEIEEALPTSDAPQLPEETTSLLRAYPNPANAGVTIEVRPPEPGSFSVGVFDLRGRRLALLRGHAASSELITLHWNSIGMEGPVPAGRYFFQLRSAGQAWMESVVILR